MDEILSSLYIVFSIFMYIFSALQKIAEMLEAHIYDDDSDGENLRASEIKSIVVMLPPADGNVTDENFNEETDRNINHNTSSQLRAEAEVYYNKPDGVILSNIEMPKKKKARDWKCTDHFSKTVPELVEKNISHDNKSVFIYMINFTCLKIAKLLEYFWLLSKLFLQNFDNVFTLDISIDETIVLYYGKQHIQGKPIRFGYKLWSACTPLSYLIQFILYQRSKGWQLPHQKTYRLGASVVLELLSFLLKNQKYKLYFNNFFSGMPLLYKLSELGHFGSVTIRENQNEKCWLNSQKEVKKKECGALCMATTSDMMIVRWNDKNIVTLASNAYAIQPLSTITRIVSSSISIIRTQVE